MKAVVGVLLMLLRVSHGAAVSCDGRQDGAQYYGALGGSVELPLENDFSQLRRVDLKKNGSVYYRFIVSHMRSYKDGKIVFYSNNGSFRINDLKMSDSGEYELRMFGKDGKEIGSRTVQLCVQAPVCSVQQVHQCLSQGQIKVSCLSEGDSLQYSWTLDGKTLTDSELLSGNHQTDIIVLKPYISGHLFCSVRNQVSSSSNEINIPDCGPSVWLILGLRAFAVSLPIILLCLYFTWKKKKLEKSEQPDVSPTMENPGTCVLMVPLNSHLKQIPP